MLRLTILSLAVADIAEHPEKHSVLLIPIAIRIAFLFSRPVFDFFYHKFVHGAIHASGHKVALLNTAFKKFKFLPDVLMIGALAVLQIFVG